jgi:hypothetical protein
MYDLLMPNAINFSFVYYYALLLGTAVYIPGFPKVGKALLRSIPGSDLTPHPAADASPALPLDMCEGTGRWQLYFYMLAQRKKVLAKAKAKSS